MINLKTDLEILKAHAEVLIFNIERIIKEVDNDEIQEPKKIN